MLHGEETIEVKVHLCNTSDSYPVNPRSLHREGTLIIAVIL